MNNDGEPPTAVPTMPAATETPAGPIPEKKPPAPADIQTSSSAELPPTATRIKADRVVSLHQGTPLICGPMSPKLAVILLNLFLAMWLWNNRTNSVSTGLDAIDTLAQVVGHPQMILVATLITGQSEFVIAVVLIILDYAGRKGAPVERAKVCVNVFVIAYSTLATMIFSIFSIAAALNHTGYGGDTKGIQIFLAAISVALLSDAFFTALLLLERRHRQWEMRADGRPPWAVAAAGARITPGDLIGKKSGVPI